MTETDNRDLIVKIGASLEGYRYSEADRDFTSDASLTALFVTPRRWMCRYACAIVRASNDVTGLHDCKKLSGRIRNALSKHYGQWPWFKEIGTYMVFLCSHPLYLAILGHESEFKDNTGIHVNVMLGSCFVDIDERQVSSESTWGLFYSGKHYRAISSAIEQWCNQRKEA